jgi:hypothetical protein
LLEAILDLEGSLRGTGLLELDSRIRIREIIEDLGLKDIKDPMKEFVKTFVRRSTVIPM